MPKYRIILESEENISDEEFQAEIDFNFKLARQRSIDFDKYKIIEAVNLEGMKGEDDEISGNI